jgi:GAF domain-containing protein
LVLAARDVFARAPQPADAGVIGFVVQTGRPQRVSAASLAEMEALILPEHRPHLRSTPTYSLLAVPLRARGQILGALSVSRQTPDRPYSAADEQFLQDLADRAGLAIETARLYAAEAAMRAEAELAAARLREVNEHLVVASLREQALAEEADAARRRSDFLAESSAILSSSLDYETRLTSLMRLAVPLLADWCAIDMVRDDGQIHRLAVVHADPAKAEAADELRRRYPVLAPDARHTIVRVLRDRVSWFDASVGEPRFSVEARDPAHLDLLRRLGFASEMVVPMLAYGRAIGTLTFVFGESGRRHTPADLALAEELAGRAALALDNARLHREIKASEERFRTLADAMPQLVWTADSDGVFEFYNSRFAV